MILLKNYSFDIKQQSLTQSIGMYFCHDSIYIKKTQLIEVIITYLKVSVVWCAGLEDGISWGWSPISSKPKTIKFVLWNNEICLNKKIK